MSDLILMNENATMTTKNVHGNVAPIKEKINSLFDDVMAHDGFGEIRVEMNILKRNQKEIILHCGKQYRFVVDMPEKEST